jgi:ABC-type transport system substrate-binding protein
MQKKHMAIVFGIAIVGIFLSLSAAPAVNAQTYPESDPAWFYDNLTPADRQKIRQAMDYLIPRQQIVEGLHQGYAFPTATSINKQLVGYYNASIVARQYNTTKASELLADVFGYEWNATLPYYYDMVLLAPTTNALRTQWAALISQSFSEVGINSEVRYRTWGVIIPRVFNEPVGVGFDYAHGGHDAYFIGWSSSADIDQSSMFGGDYFVPAGDNGGWINNSDADALWDAALNSLDVADRIQAVNDFQAWYYDMVPMSIMRQSIDLFAFDGDLEGFDLYLQGGYYQNMTHPTQTDITYSIPGEFVDYNPQCSNSYYDTCLIGAAHYGLASRRGAYNLTHSVPTPITDHWNVSGDQLVWDVKLKEGYLFSNGEELNASDVVFTYKSAFYTGRSFTASALTIFENESAIEATGEYTVRFTLPKFYPYMSTGGLGFPILNEDEFIGYGLGDYRDADQWAAHVSNTEYSPAGLGPYNITGYVGTKDSATLYPNTNHQGFSDAGAVGGGIYWQDPALNVTLKVIKDPALAWTELKTGVIDGIDAQTGVQSLAADIIADPDNVLLQALEYGWQELVYNQFSPIYGMNPGDPREMYPEDYVTEEPSVSYITTVISGTTIIETVTIVQSPGFGALVLIGASASLAFLYKKKRR